MSMSTILRMNMNIIISKILIMNMNIMIIKIILNILDILSIFAFPQIRIKMMILDLVTLPLSMLFRR
jgi:hypothetical protein